jgi:hypothetical protein
VNPRATGTPPAADVVEGNSEDESSEYEYFEEEIEPPVSDANLSPTREAESSPDAELLAGIEAALGGIE